MLFFMTTIDCTAASAGRRSRTGRGLPTIARCRRSPPGCFAPPARDANADASADQVDAPAVAITPIFARTPGSRGRNFKTLLDFGHFHLEHSSGIPGRRARVRSAGRACGRPWRYTHARGHHPQVFLRINWSRRSLPRPDSTMKLPLSSRLTEPVAIFRRAREIVQDLLALGVANLLKILLRGLRRCSRTRSTESAAR